MTNRLTNILAVCVLAFMFLIAVFSIRGDSLTMDELAHLPAGYSYLTQKDMRLNPEHPPLMKDMAALPLLLIKGINFPSDAKSWDSDVNGQWEFGNKFLFNSSNPADTMIFWARIPMILILMLLGFYLFRWSQELFGNNTALLSLFMFAFSPTFIAHGRLVTTDVAAAAGAFIATYYFVKFLQNSSKENLIKAGLFFGLAEIFKFSLILLIPFFGFLFVIWAAIHSSRFGTFWRVFLKYLLYFILIMIIGFIVIFAVYQYHVWNYPDQKQVSDTSFILSSFSMKPLSNAVIWMADKPVLKPIAQYALGLFMIFQRASGGNTGYFLGEVSAAGWKSYFPTVYLIKEPLTFHILTIIAILYLAWALKRPFWQEPLKRLIKWLRSYFPEFAMLVFMAIYWTVSLRSNLNIGVRHLLPVFPFTIILVGGAIFMWIEKPFLKKTKIILVSVLLIWQAISVLSIYPHFLSYFNELIGGPDNGYLYVTDSNLDWGQDLKRLKDWTEKNNIDKIYIDYFGGADIKYYFKDKYVPWQGDKNKKEEMPEGSYFAVSATFLQGGRGRPGKGFDLLTGYYGWLNDYTPVARIGYSIFVYYIDPSRLILANPR